MKPRLKLTYESEFKIAFLLLLLFLVLINFGTLYLLKVSKTSLSHEFDRKLTTVGNAVTTLFKELQPANESVLRNALVELTFKSEVEEIYVLDFGPQYLNPGILITTDLRDATVMKRITEQISKSDWDKLKKGDSKEEEEEDAFDEQEIFSLFSVADNL